MSKRPPSRSAQSQPIVRSVAYQSVTSFSVQPQWSPSVNIYQRADRLEVCVELAGVDAEHLEVTIEPGRLAIRGVRPTPDPPDHAGEPMRIVAMELDHGRFARVIALPQEVDIQRVRRTMDCGLLWIILPLRSGE